MAGNVQTGAILDVQDKPKFLQWVGLSLQHMFSMFGSTVLVPLLVGLNPGIALFSSGVGTLLHILITRKQIPAYMGSSFAFILPMTALMKTTGYPGVAAGVISVGVIYLLVAGIVAKFGSAWIEQLLPPIVVGPIVMVIGLSLAGSAASSATLLAGKYDLRVFAVAMITLGLTIFFNMYLKGFLGMIPILLGIIAGYIVAIAFGLVDLKPVADAAWFALPKFELPFVTYKPVMYWNAVIVMAPLALVTITEHLGHLMVLGELTGRDYFKNPGLNRTLAGDGAASVFAGLVGGPSVTSYGENIGVMAITKVHSVYVLIGAAIFAILFAFIGKLSALIQSIPGAVTGGISFLLFGVIAVSGLRIVVENQLDFNDKRNLMIASSVLVIGIGNAYLQIGQGTNIVQFSGVAIATILGITLNIILPKTAASEK
ncbi:solute carrier family 23 protein [Weissella soli]|uniref:Uracil permease n=1 Tax=Weissella soli TaxID=155866 RepID=A0A288QUD2_9LACO|nr:solute carrier family 23 protein [Weissella soli]AOT55713.1 Uracil permease [Weissella soli]NKY83526.1 uracil permease [Weissella soli]RDL06613.1 uracil permease [Weissella soli]GEN93335.1 xanthine/uracil permease [Weissella soli]